MKLTKEQQEKLNEDIEYNKIHGEYICEDCNAQLIGMTEVHKHVDSKQHHSFKPRGSRLILAIG